MIVGYVWQILEKGGFFGSLNLEKSRKSPSLIGLTVAEKKKHRLVLDFCHVNKFIKQNKFRYNSTNNFLQPLI